MSISVLMPVYNAEVTIEKTILGIQCQTFKNYELIIVDDGSTDNTYSIIEKLQKHDQRIKIVKKSNSGIIDSLNLGLKYCKGNYIVRHDTDDYSHIERLRILYDYMDRNPKVDCLFSKNYLLNKEGKIIGISPLRHIQNVNLMVDNNVSIISHPTVIFRKEAIDAIGSYPDYKYIEDFALWKTMRQKEFNFEYIKIPLYATLKSTSGISYNNRKIQLQKYYEYIKVKHNSTFINNKLREIKIREYLMYGVSYEGKDVSIHSYIKYFIIRIYSKYQIFINKKYEAGFNY